MANVVLKNLHKKYPNGVQAVRDFSLEVDDGEFIVLLGPSGCGKSTTLRMVAGLEDPMAGEISIGGRCMSGVAPAKRDVAMVFQNYALYPHMSVYANMAFGLKMRGTPRLDIERRVREAAAMLEIESLLDRRPGELSGGQQQRVALGRAIVREPQVFLFDEPLSDLDARLRVQMRAEIVRLQRRLKATVIYVTHDQAEAMTLGDRMVLMDHGVIQQVDVPMKVYQRPVNRFVASFIGNPSMNFVNGEMAGGVFRFAHEANGTEMVAIEVGSGMPSGPATLGIRPEDLLARGDGTPLGSVTLDVVEHLGHETIAHFTLAGGEQVARLPAGATVQSGDRLPLAMRPGAFHLFAADNGRRLN